MEVPRSTLDSFDDFVASRLQQERDALAARWLFRLRELLQTDPQQVFPGDDLLDHIPGLLDEIASYVRTPEALAIAANATVIAKARELGLLRHSQRASLHQVLREFEILAEMLEQFIRSEVAQFSMPLPAEETLAVYARTGRAVRTLMRTTVEAFVEQYTATIEEQSKQLDAFVSMVTHELRTPIGTLVVAAKLLGVTSVNDQPRKRERIIETIERNAQLLADKVVQLQRMAIGDTTLDLPTEQEIDPTVIAREAARQLRTMAEDRGVEMGLEEGLPTVIVDPARLELVLMNLLSNAIKYCDPQKPKRWVTVRPAPSSPGYWSFSVVDNGIGIPLQAQETIFDKFVRAHSERDEEFQADGLGLGLAIVRESIDALGGAITCASTPGEGTAFTVRLPLKQAPRTSTTTLP